jgi:phenylacetate-CoA ligase
VNPLLGLVEVIDDGGAPAIEGRLVCTTLANTAMPLVRYEIGDSAARRVDPCPCGCQWPALRAILGREDDVIVTPDGRRIGRMDHIFKGVRGIRECQVVQETTIRVLLRLVADADFSGRDLLLTNARARLGQGMEVSIETVDRIPRTAGGKFRGVVNLTRQRQRPNSVAARNET